MYQDQPKTLKRIKTLIVFMSLSLFLNVFFGAYILYSFLTDTPPVPFFEQRPALAQEQLKPLTIQKGNVELIHYFRLLSFEELLEHLTSKRLTENGYMQRDIALACLTSFHHFDLQRALLGHSTLEQKRFIPYGVLKDKRPALLTVYPGLNDHQFAAVIQFAKEERWPLSSKGIFLKLKKQKDKSSSLLDAFYMTGELLSLQLLLKRADESITRQEIAYLALEGSWNYLSDFSKQQKLILDLTAAKRQKVLLDYLNFKSKTAAYLLLKQDYDFAKKKLDDTQAMRLLELLEDKTVLSETYAKDLLISPRGDNVWKMAAAVLYKYAGEEVPDKNIHHMAMKKFLKQTSVEIAMVEEAPLIPVSVSIPTPKVEKPTSKPKVAPKQVFARKDRHYVVQEGDTLWKVSKKFNVHVDALRSYNRLKTDALKPGSELRIP